MLGISALRRCCGGVLKGCLLRSPRPAGSGCFSLKSAGVGGFVFSVCGGVVLGLGASGFGVSMVKAFCARFLGCTGNSAGSGNVMLAPGRVASLFYSVTRRCLNGDLSDSAGMLSAYAKDNKFLVSTLREVSEGALTGGLSLRRGGGRLVAVHERYLVNMRGRPCVCTLTCTGVHFRNSNGSGL